MAMNDICDFTRGQKLTIQNKEYLVVSAKRTSDEFMLIHLISSGSRSFVLKYVGYNSRHKQFGKVYTSKNKPLSQEEIQNVRDTSKSLQSPVPAPILTPTVSISSSTNSSDTVSVTQIGSLRSEIEELKALIAANAAAISKLQEGTERIEKKLGELVDLADRLVGKSADKPADKPADTEMEASRHRQKKERKDSNTGVVGAGGVTGTGVKAEIERIVLARAEGLHHEILTVRISGATADVVWKGAENTLRLWAQTAPEDGSCHKCDVWLHFTDRESFKLQIDLERKHTTSGVNLTEVVRRRFEFLSGKCPSHMTPEQYRNYIKSANINCKHYQQFVNSRIIPKEELHQYSELGSLPVVAAIA